MRPLRRFLEGDREGDRGLSTDKLKLILKLANVDEAFDKGGVLQSEKHLLNTWNAKPVRARWVAAKRARWVTLRACWVTLRARWVTLRARWVTLRELAG